MISTETAARCSSALMTAPIGGHSTSGAPLKTTVFAVAVDPARPDNIFCTSKVGQVFSSIDRGKHWRMNPLPAGVGHVFALAAG